VVAAEHERVGIPVHHGHSHAWDPNILAREEAEYAAADLLLVPSPFSERTFKDRGFSQERLAPHAYGFDPTEFFPDPARLDGSGPLTYLFAARCEPRKGLHYLLRAWHESGLARRARLIICGEFVPGYREVVAPLLDDPSVEVRGYVPDLSELMREADVFVLPSVEEGSALVTYEAQACGCVLVVSDATGARCEHRRTGLVHPARDVDSLAAHLRELEGDPALRQRLRDATVARLHELTWDRSAAEQADVYAAALAGEIGAR
jgi:glycosyltransferase involved in cell wall biosynthesis